MKRPTPPPPNTKRNAPMKIPKPPTITMPIRTQQPQQQQTHQNTNKITPAQNSYPHHLQSSNNYPQPQKQIPTNQKTNQQKLFTNFKTETDNLMQNQYGGNNQSDLTNNQMSYAGEQINQEQQFSQPKNGQQNNQQRVTVNNMNKPPPPKTRVVGSSGTNKKAPKMPLNKLVLPKIPVMPLIPSQNNQNQQNILQVNQTYSNQIVDKSSLAISSTVEQFKIGQESAVIQLTKQNYSIEQQSIQTSGRNMEGSLQYNQLTSKTQITKAKTPQKLKTQSLPTKNVPPRFIKNAPSPNKIQPLQNKPLQSSKKIQQNPRQSQSTIQQPMLPKNDIKNNIKSQIISPVPSNQYNDLQQKLRKLQLMRSRIDQSSQQQYQEQQNEINIDQQQYEGSYQNSQQNQQQKIKNQNINIIQNRQVQQNQQMDHYDIIDRSSNRQEFRIQQTNFEEMEINDQNQQEQERIDMQITQRQGNSNFQKVIVRSEQPHPIVQTVYQSNIATEQTQHKYLPDQVSNSLGNNQQISNYNDMVDKQNLQPQTSNNVRHVSNYHSLTNFAVQEGKMNVVRNQVDINAQNQHIVADEIRQDKSDGELVKPKSINQSYNQNVIKHKEQSLQMVHQDQCDILPNDQKYQSNKQNVLTVSNLISKTKTIKNQINKKPSDNIEDLLQQFRSKKQQYLRNIQDLKKIDQQQKVQTQKYQQKIHRLLDQINHKNMLILRHANNINPQGSGYQQLKSKLGQQPRYDRIANYDRTQLGDRTQVNENEQL